MKMVEENWRSRTDLVYVIIEEEIGKKENKANKFIRGYTDNILLTIFHPIGFLIRFRTAQRFQLDAITGGNFIVPFRHITTNAAA